MTCPKCGRAKVFLEKDHYGPYRSCLCGWSGEVNPPEEYDPEAEYHARRTEAWRVQRTRKQQQVIAARRLAQRFL